MARIYVKEGTVFDEPRLVEQPFSLFQLFDSGRQFYIDGIEIFKGGSDAWREYLEREQRELREQGVSEKSIQQHLERIAFQPSIKPNTFIAETSFAALSYREVADTPFATFVSDKRLNIFGNIIMPAKVVHVLPYFRENRQPTEGFSEPAERFFKHHTDAGNYGWFYYDGSLCDAFESFLANGFFFHRAEWLAPHSVPPYLASRDCVSLGEIFERE